MASTIYSDATAITVLVATNPKRAGTPSAARFALYATTPTVGEFIKAGGRRADLSWDLARNFIAVGASFPPAPAKAPAQEATPAK